MSDRYAQLADVLHRLRSSEQASLYARDEEALSRHVSALSEDMHWSLLVAGFVLFDVSSGDTEHDESAHIAAELMAYSSACSPYTDLATLASLFERLNTVTAAASASVAPANRTSGAARPLPVNLALVEPGASLATLTGSNNNNSSPDPIVSIVFTALQYAELETFAFAVGLLDKLSPQVAATLAWFLKETARCFLFMREANYEQLSATLHTVFGVDTPAATQVLCFMLRKCYANFYTWSAETAATTHSARLLVELCRNRETSRLLVSGGDHKNQTSQIGSVHLIHFITNHSKTVNIVPNC